MDAVIDRIPAAEALPGPDGKPIDENAPTEKWRKSIPADVRAQIVQLHKLTPWTKLKMLALLGIWAGCAAIAITVDSLWVRVPCWIIIGFTLHSFGVFMHEGSHNSLFRKPWLDRPIGFLCGLPVFFPCSSYRATHLLHHQYQNSPQDPDNLEANFPNKTLRWLLYYGWFATGMPVYILLVTVTGPIRARGWKEKLACVIEPALIVGFYYALFTAASRYDFWPILLNGWAWAVPFAIIVANFRGLAEHTQLWHKNPPDQLHSTRSLVSNKFISFFFNNQNHHLEHHLFPGVPWNNLSKIHKLLLPIYDKHQASVTKGYLQWFAGALRYGPNRTISYRQREAVLDQR